MLVFFGNNIVDVLDQPDESRKQISNIGNELRLRVDENRYNNLHQNFAATDTESLGLMLKIIAHEQVYRDRSSMADRRIFLYNICRTVCLLSQSAHGIHEPVRFKERYTFEDNSIWRDLEYLHKALIPDDQQPIRRSFEIDDFFVNNILEQDIPKIAELAIMELSTEIIEQWVGYNCFLRPISPKKSELEDNILYVYLSNEKLMARVKGGEEVELSRAKVNPVYWDEVNQALRTRPISAISPECIRELNNNYIFETNKQLVRDNYKATSLLTNTFLISTYYREMESLHRVIEYTDPVFIQGLDLSTKSARACILRSLEVIGEFVSKKNLSSYTRNQYLSMDWDLLVAVRNKLAHHEWLLASNKGFIDLIATPMDDAIKDDIGYIHNYVQTILTDLLSTRESSASNPILLMSKLKERYQSRSETIIISLELEEKVKDYIKFLKENNIISFKSYDELTLLLGDRLDLSKIDLTDILQQKIGIEKLQTDYINSLKEQGFKEFEEVKNEFRQIRGELQTNINVNKITKQSKILLNKLKEQNLITEADHTKFQKTLNSSKNSNELLLVITLIKQSYQFYLEEEVSLVDIKTKIDKASNIKTKNDLIKKLYDGISKLATEELKESKVAIQDILGKKLPNEETSRLVSELKSEAIDRFFMFKGVVINKTQLELSKEFYSIYKDLSPNSNNGPHLTERILKYLQRLAQDNYISSDTQSSLCDLLKSLKFNDVVEALEQEVNKVGEELKKNQSEELTVLEIVLKKFGAIKEYLKQEKDDFRKNKDRISKDIELEKSTKTPTIRVLVNGLPKAAEQKPLKKKQYFMHIMTNALAAINHLEGIFRSLNSHTFNAQRHSFAEYGEFVGVDPGDRDMVTSLPADLLYWERILTITELDSKFNGKIPVPYDGPSLGLTLDDSITRRTRIAGPEIRDIVRTYINSTSNHFKIINRTHDYATFLTLSRALKHNKNLFQAAEYIAGSIFAYLNELDEFQLINFPDLLKRELKAQRNVSKHGNLYVDLVDAPLDEFLVRYASIFIKNIKPELECIQRHIAR